MNQRLSMGIAPGTLSALAGAGSSNTDKSAEKCTLSGDLSQMGTMARVLRGAGFDVRHSDVYPVLQGADIVPGLKYLYDNYVAGWWNQQRELVKRGICTEQEYREHLDIECGRNR